MQIIIPGLSHKTIMRYMWKCIINIIFYNYKNYYLPWPSLPIHWTPTINHTQLARLNLEYTAWPQALHIIALPRTHVLPDGKLRTRKDYGPIIHLAVKRTQTWIRLQLSWFPLHILSYLLAHSQPCDLWFFFVYNLTLCLVKPSFFWRQEGWLSSSPFSLPQNEHKFGYPEESNNENR